MTQWSAAPWLHEIGVVADELGYGILQIEPGAVVLGRDQVTVRVESILMSGSLLRDVLRPHAESVEQPADSEREVA